MRASVFATRRSGLPNYSYAPAGKLLLRACRDCPILKSTALSIGRIRHVRMLAAHVKEAINVELQSTRERAEAFRVVVLEGHLITQERHLGDSPWRGVLVDERESEGIAVPM